MILFIIEAFTTGRGWHITGWKEAESLEDVLKVENELVFVGERFNATPQPWRVRPASNIEAAYARERNEFLSEQYA